MRRLLLFLPSLSTGILSAAVAGGASFANAVESSKVDFTREVQPILAEHCFKCHGQDEKMRKSGLRLDLREAALKGGKNDGAALVAGKPEASAIVARITSHEDDEMM